MCVFVSVLGVLFFHHLFRAMTGWGHSFLITLQGDAGPQEYFFYRPTLQRSRCMRSAACVCCAACAHTLPPHRRDVHPMCMCASAALHPTCIVHTHPCRQSVMHAHTLRMHANQSRHTTRHTNHASQGRFSEIGT